MAAAEPAAPPLNSLPSEVLLPILLRALPTVRQRIAGQLVCATWRALLNQPEAHQELDFSDMAHVSTTAVSSMIQKSRDLSGGCILESLNVSGASEVSMAELMPVLRDCRNLKEVIACEGLNGRPKLNYYLISELIYGLGNSQKATWTLDLEINKLHSKYFGGLMAAVAGKIPHVKVKGCQLKVSFGDVIWDDIAQAIHANMSLERLSLFFKRDLSPPHGIDFYAWLFSRIEFHESLSQLDIVGLPPLQFPYDFEGILSETTSINIRNFFSSLPCLKRLSFKGCFMPDFLLKGLISYLASPYSRCIEECELIESSIYDTEAAEMVVQWLQALEWHQNLKILRWSSRFNNELTTLASLIGNKALQVLDLRRSTLSHYGVMLLLEHLKHDTQLSVLRMDDCTWSSSVYDFEGTQLMEAIYESLQNRGGLATFGLTLPPWRQPFMKSGEAHLLSLSSILSVIVRLGNGEERLVQMLHLSCAEVNLTLFDRAMFRHTLGLVCLPNVKRGDEHYGTILTSRGNIWQTHALGNPFQCPIPLQHPWHQRAFDSLMLLLSQHLAGPLWALTRLLQLAFWFVCQPVLVLFVLLSGIPSWQEIKLYSREQVGYLREAGWHCCWPGRMLFNGVLRLVYKPISAAGE